MKAGRGGALAGDSRVQSAGRRRAAGRAICSWSWSPSMSLVFFRAARLAALRPPARQHTASLIGRRDAASLDPLPAIGPAGHSSGIARGFGQGAKPRNSTRIPIHSRVAVLPEFGRRLFLVAAPGAIGAACRLLDFRVSLCLTQSHSSSSPPTPRGGRPTTRKQTRIGSSGGSRAGVAHVVQRDVYVQSA